MNEAERREQIEQDAYRYPWHLMSDAEVIEFGLSLIEQRLTGAGHHLRDRHHNQFHKLAPFYRDNYRRIAGFLLGMQPGGQRLLLGLANRK